MNEPGGTAYKYRLDYVAVAGKTGTADKPKPQGGYYDDKVIATFASFFPAYDPKYVLVLVLDEPEIYAAGELRRTAGWTDLVFRPPLVFLKKMLPQRGVLDGVPGVVVALSTATSLPPSHTCTSVRKTMTAAPRSG